MKHRSLTFYFILNWDNTLTTIAAVHDRQLKNESQGNALRAWSAILRCTENGVAVIKQQRCVNLK